MIKKILAAKEIKKRIADNRVAIGLLTFKETPTEVAKIEQLPACFMVYGVDTIIKRSTRSASPSRAAMPNIRSAEIILELVAKKSSNVVDIYTKVCEYVLEDMYPLKDVNGIPDGATFMLEERTEGPIGYGLPDVEAMILVISLTYPDVKGE